MRHASKMWDNAPNKPLRLKERLAEAGRSHGWLADQVAKKGYKISRVTIWGVINKQYRTIDYDRLKKVVEEVLTEHKISIQGIWHYLPGAEYMMYQIKPRGWRRRALRAHVGTRCTVSKHVEIQMVGTRSSVSLQRPGKEGEEMNYTKSYLDEEVLRHFGLESDPFYDVLDFTDIWISPRLKVVERRFYDTIRRHGIMAIIGDIGAGKTTFLRYVLTKMLKEKSIKIIYPDRMDRKQLSGSALTQAVITQMGGQRIPRSAVERDALAKRLLEENVKMGSNPVLILDEAHDLREEAYIALKRIWDSGMIFKLLSIILVGQGGEDDNHNSYGLRHTLEQNPWIREFAERCYLVDIGSLNGSMAQYLDFRFKKAGGDVHKIFGDKALAMLSKRSDVPQLANNIAIRAMVAAFRDGKRQVEAEHVAEA